MSYGTQTYNDETYAGYSIQLDSIAPNIISRIGGDTLVLSGLFHTEQSYKVTVDGIVAYSGVEGNAEWCESEDGVSLAFVFPQLDLSAVGVVNIAVLSDTGESAYLNGVLTVLERNFGTVPFEMRRMMPPWYGVGARRLEMEDPEE